MKKITALLLVFTLAAALMTGCGPKTPAEPSASPSQPVSADPSAAPSGTEAAGGDAVRTGFAVINSIAKSTDATAEADGLAQADSFSWP
jgi:predicted small lipoprotein YifL